MLRGHGYWHFQIRFSDFSQRVGSRRYITAMNCGIGTSQKIENQVVVIVGPTAVGKTDLALRLAQELHGEIISADSRQIYRHMDIGTAKPSNEQRKSVPHHCVDIVDPDVSFSAGEFSRRARICIREILSRGKRPVLVGGSGLYITALLDGFFDDGGIDPELRSALNTRLKTEGLSALYEELGRVDPVRQLTLEAKDAQRIIRALELGLGRQTQTDSAREQTGTTLCASPPSMFCLTRDRQVLNGRIDRRVDDMFLDGFSEEVSHLRALGFAADCPGLSSLGYREVLECQDGSLSHEEAIASIKLRSRRYAKRQFTWFRRDRRLRWLDLDHLGQGGAIERILAQCAGDQQTGRH